MTRSQKEVLKAWIAAILWLIVIAIESSTYLSSHNTSKILYPLLHFFFGVDHVRLRDLALLDPQDRTRAWLRPPQHPALPRLERNLARPAHQRWTFRWTYIAILGTLLVASLDEWHQSLLASRTGRWQDVVLDTSAGIVAQVLVALVRLWW